MDPLIGLKDHELKHIVYVDDDEEDRILFRDALFEMNSNIKLSVFENGYHLIDFLQKITDHHHLPCSIICDMQMPLLNGVDLLAILKNDPRWQNIPVAIFSTSSALIDSDNSMKRGAIGFFSKPVTFDALIATIAKILKRCSEALSTRVNNSTI